MLLKKIKYTLQAGVGGAGLGLAILGGFSVLFAVSFSDATVLSTSAFTSASLALYALLTA